MTDEDVIHVGYISRQELKMYAYPHDKDTNGKAFPLHSRFTNGCGSMEDVLSTDYSAFQRRI